jgi:hypothetical protein
MREWRIIEAAAEMRELNNPFITRGGGAVVICTGSTDAFFVSDSCHGS